MFINTRLIKGWCCIGDTAVNAMITATQISEEIVTGFGVDGGMKWYIGVDGVWSFIKLHIRHC